MSKNRLMVIPAVYLLLLKSEEILFLRRHNTGYCDGLYGLPAGHVDAGESLAQAMRREAFEEIGIGVPLSDLKLVHIMHRNAEDHGRLDIFFIAERWIGEPKNMEEHKCDDLRWVPMTSLPGDLIPYIKDALESIQNEKTYSDRNFVPSK